MARETAACATCAGGRFAFLRARPARATFSGDERIASKPDT